jgi:hypothetical protein
MQARLRIAGLCLACATRAFAQSSPDDLLAQGRVQQLPSVQIEGNYDNAVGTSGAASQGTVISKLIENRPPLRPAEVLEFVPGVIVTQHSGDGKANQYYLHGFTSTTAPTSPPSSPACR